MRTLPVGKDFLTHERANALKSGGIGTLGEKTLHAVLKEYYAGEDGEKEAKIGRYYADVFRNGRIIEIQTGSCSVLQRKLRAFLTEYEVTVVLPVMREKTLFWIDPESGEVSKKRKSPKKGRITDALPEMLYLEEFLPHPGFKAEIFLYDGEEYRLSDGWGNGGKRGAHRFERLPKDAAERYILSGIRDAGKLLPDGCFEKMTREDFARLTGFRGRKLWAALKFLCGNGILTAKKSGKRLLYTVNEDKNEEE